MLLCIDDNEHVLECEKAFLESFGYTVLTAPSDGKGLELASIHAVDVVIVDYLMPAMNGEQVAMEMRRLTPQAPIIMLSGAVDVPEQALKWVGAFIAKDCLAACCCQRLRNCRNVDRSRAIAQLLSAELEKNS